MLKMYIRSLCIRIFSFFYISRVAHAQLTVDELFNWDIGSDQGRCSPSQLETINLWIQEAYELSNAALWACGQEFTTLDEHIMPFFRSYLGVEFDLTWEPKTDAANNNLNRAKETFQQVAGFLETGSLYYSTLKPFLACDDTAFHQVSWYDAVLDSAGESVPKSKNDADGYYTYEDLWGAENLDGQILYWSELQRGVCAENAPERPCTGAAAFVTWSYDVLPEVGVATTPWAASVNFCPQFLQITGNSQYLDSLDDLVYPTPDAPILLDSQLTKSISFFHELTHLVNPDVKDYYYPLNEVIYNAFKLLDKNSVKNAQSYMFFAVAVWYVLNTPEGTTPATFYYGNSDDTPTKIPNFKN